MKLPLIGRDIRVRLSDLTQPKLGEGPHEHLAR